MEQFLTDRVIDLAIAIQQIPAPTFFEGQRADFVRQCFHNENLADVQVDDTGNVYARLPGSGGGRPVVVSAHMDTVFPENTELTFVRNARTISGPGIGDNSLGVAGLLGLVWGLRQSGIALPGDVWLAANVCEEGLGNLRGMKAVVDRFGAQALAYIIVEGMAYGQIYICGLSVDRYRITVQTAGGHSWVDYGHPSAIHEIARLVVQLTGLALPQKPRTTLNAGTIQGGTTVNTIASRAELELDIRSESNPALEELARQVQELVRQVNRPGIEASIQQVGRRPAGEISLRHPLVRIAGRILKEQGIKPNFNAGSTDANIPLSQGLPAICIGLTTGSGAHTTAEKIQVTQLANGLEQLVKLVTQVFEEL